MITVSTITGSTGFFFSGKVYTVLFTDEILVQPKAEVEKLNP